MITRISMTVDEATAVRYRRQAEREGMSLAAWLREAAEERMRAADARRRLRTVDALEAFFAECDDRETRPEPDWAEQRRLIELSRTSGLRST